VEIERIQRTKEYLLDNYKHVCTMSKAVRKGKQALAKAGRKGVQDKKETR
jgi:hypothetical protein